MRKLVVAMCTENSWLEDPVFVESTNIGLTIEDFQFTYSHFFTRAAEENIKMVRTNFAWYDKRRGIFKKGWIHDPILGWTKILEFKPDLIFDKMPLNSQTIPYKQFFSKKKMILNPYSVEALASDKIKTYQKFKEYVPVSIKVNNRAELKKALGRIPTDRFVIKPISGANADGVSFYDKSDFTKAKIYKNWMVQEFVDPRDRARDYRILVAGGKYLHALMRQGGKGTLVSNIATGGKATLLTKKEVPKAVLQQGQKVIKLLEEYPQSLLSLDFMIDKQNNAKMIEMNSKPGFIYYHRIKGMSQLRQIEQALIEMFWSF